MMVRTPRPRLSIATDLRIGLEGALLVSALALTALVGGATGCESDSVPPEMDGSGSGLCTTVPCGNGHCDPSEIAPWGSVCPQDCPGQFVGQLEPGLPTENNYGDFSPLYLGVFGRVPDNLRIAPYLDTVLDGARRSAILVVAPQEDVTAASAPVKFVFLDPARGAINSACRGIATQAPQFRFQVRDATSALWIRTRMPFPVALIMRGPDHQESCLDIPYRELGTCDAGHMPQYATRGALVELSMHVEHPALGLYSLWVTRLSWWDGMGRGDLAVWLGDAASAPPPLPSTTEPLAAPAAAPALATTAVRTVPSTFVPATPARPVPIEDTTQDSTGAAPPSDSRAGVVIAPVSSRALRDAQDLIDRCRNAEGAQQRQLGSEGLAVLERAGVTGPDADTAKRNLRACAEAPDVQ